MLGAITAAVVVVAAVTSSVTHTMLASDIRRSINERIRRLDWENHCEDLDECGPDCFRRHYTYPPFIYCIIFNIYTKNWRREKNNIDMSMGGGATIIRAPVDLVFEKRG